MSAEVDEIRLIRESAAAIAPRGGDLKRVRALRGARPGFDLDMWRRMAGLGWLDALGDPEGGLGSEAFCALCEELGAGLAPEPLGLAGPVLRLLPPDVREEATAGQTIVIPAWQEAPNALDSGEKTTFRNGRVTGTKLFVPFADAAEFFLVATRDGMALVRRDDPGVSTASADGFDGAPLATLRFENAAGRPVEGDFAPLLDEMILAASAYLLGAMDGAFAMALAYMATRRQFGRPIGSFQVLQHRAVDLKIQIELTRAVVREAALLLDAGAEPASRRAAVSRAKARASEAAMLVARETIQFHGAIGITEEADIGLYCRKLMALAGQYGSAATHRARFMALGGRACTEPGEDAGPDDSLPAGDGPSRDYNAMSDAAFRAEVRAWIEANYPPELRFPVQRLHRRETKVWYDRLTEKGWLAPNWPREHGGMGLDPAKRIIFIEEYERHGCSRYSDQGVLMIGPLLMSYGTEAQRALFLPKIMTGEHIWAQGYSEPNAGSDLASLRTRAVLEGDEWVVNGQKTWTSLGNDANWIYLLVRTDPEAKKQEGISFLLVPMDSPGVTVRPILTLNGSDDFCEVFFDDVRVPRDMLVGEPNRGWGMAKTLLGFERIFVGSPAQSAFAIGRLEQLAEALGLTGEPTFRERYARLSSDLADHSSLYATFVEKLRRGETIGPDVSMLKVHQTELYKRIAQEAAEIAGPLAFRLDAPMEIGEVNVAGLWLHTLQTTIYGGTSEIQRDILAKQVLGMLS